MLNFKYIQVQSTNDNYNRLKKSKYPVPMGDRIIQKCHCNMLIS